MNLIIFGPQGSGKGTQAEKLAEKFNLSHIESGQIFRVIAKDESVFGKMIRNLIKEGEVVPDETTVEVLNRYVKKVSVGQGLILDSAPRTVGQIELVEKMMASYNRKIDKAIYISLPYQQSVERITKRYLCTACAKSLVLGRDIETSSSSCPSCGGLITQRADDTIDGITKRLDIFYSITVPVIEYYRKKGILIEIDGSREIEEVFRDIIKQL
ncbi:MAG: adenylate kinase [Candidatus Moranbacteria bacterium]|nr:adenylate kinase [Candidatus Moranbacteria bacterium]